MSGVLKDLPVSVSAFEDGMHHVEKMVVCDSNPGGTMLSADNVTYANDSLASHHKTARVSHRARMELEGGSLYESQRLHLQDLGWSSAGSLTSSADALGRFTVRSEEAPENLHLTFNFSGGRPKAICGVS